MEKKQKSVPNKTYQCKNCKWKGPESELEYDETETCFGDDKIETCPKCGSLDIHPLMHLVK